MLTDMLPARRIPRNHQISFRCARHTHELRPRCIRFPRSHGRLLRLRIRHVRRMAVYETEFRKYPNVYRSEEGMMKVMPFGMVAIVIGIVVVAILYAKIDPAGGAS